MTLFRMGSWELHSGARSKYKIDCDALTGEDWACLAVMIADLVGPFGDVVGVPTGGQHLEVALRRHLTEGPRLIVDDVLTTGASMEECHTEPTDIGAVVFARGECPVWVTPLFRMGPDD